MNKGQSPLWTRRNFLKAALGSIVLPGCTVNFPPFAEEGQPRTGIEGFDTCHDFIQNLNLHQLRDDIYDTWGEGFYIFTEGDFPNLSGKWNLEGKCWAYENRRFTDESPLAPGIVEFSNQTLDGYIDFSYAQDIQWGSGPGRTIIRGEQGKYYDIYALAEVADANSKIWAAIAWAGAKTTPSAETMPFRYFFKEVRHFYGSHFIPTFGKGTLSSLSIQRAAALIGETPESPLIKPAS